MAHRSLDPASCVPCRRVTFCRSRARTQIHWHWFFTGRVSHWQQFVHFESTVSSLWQSQIPQNAVQFTSTRSCRHGSTENGIHFKNLYASTFNGNAWKGLRSRILRSLPLGSLSTHFSFFSNTSIHSNLQNYPTASPNHRWMLLPITSDGVRT